MAMLIVALIILVIIIYRRFERIEDEDEKSADVDKGAFDGYVENGVYIVGYC